MTFPTQRGPALFAMGLIPRLGFGDLNRLFNPHLSGCAASLILGAESDGNRVSFTNRKPPAMTGVQNFSYD